MKRNRKHAKHLVLSCFAILMPLLASADVEVEVPNVDLDLTGFPPPDFKVNGIYYKVVDKENLTVEVAYRGDFPDEYSGVVTIPATTTYNDTVYSVTSIGWGAFAHCSSLSGVNIPKSVTSIGIAAFFGCSSLSSVNIPKSVTIIELGTFCYCSSLTSITIPEGVTSIGIATFFGCSGLTSITIPKTVTSIGEWAFCQCSSLSNVNIPESVTTIEGGAFLLCSSIVSINIPEAVTSIGEAAFYNCSSLTSITIPERVTNIGDYAFYDCSSLTSIVCKAITPPSTSNDTFYKVDTSIPVYVPSTSVADYQVAEGWKDFTNIIDMYTRIENPELKYGNSEAAIYDLNGRRITNMENLPVGIYIQNGKKFVVM